jgi:hypothetical protein
VIPSENCFYRQRGAARGLAPAASERVVYWVGYTRVTTGNSGSGASDGCSKRMTPLSTAGQVAGASSKRYRKVESWSWLTARSISYTASTGHKRWYIGRSICS